jgi:uncharacterized protein (DUF433 family)
MPTRSVPEVIRMLAQNVAKVSAQLTAKQIKQAIEFERKRRGI